MIESEEQMVESKSVGDDEMASSSNAILVKECATNDSAAGSIEVDKVAESPVEMNNNKVFVEDREVNRGEAEEEEPMSDPHLERVQVELDRLNYSNESINNLELELEDAKREYVNMMQDTDEQLTAMEKKLGACVEKSRPYYEARIDLNECKNKYLKAKFRFETAQELYVAAKNMQMYAEENLESFDHNSTNPDSPRNLGLDKESLTKMLEIAKIKVNETELSKHSSDIEQIEAGQIYELKKQRVEQMEKELKKFLEKSRKYFEVKAILYKELRFLFTKIEGLKSCLQEAKQCYQQSLRNLESISTEIHTQRQSMSIPNGDHSPSKQPDTTAIENCQTDVTNQELKSSSLSTLSSESSSSLSATNPTTNETVAASTAQQDATTSEDIDAYFKQDAENKLKEELEIKPPVFPSDESTEPPAIVKEQSEAPLNSTTCTTTTTTSQPSVLISTVALMNIPDEEIENLKLDQKLKQYNDTLTKKKRVDESKEPKATSDNASNDSNVNNSTNRPQFRVPSFWSSISIGGGTKKA